ncbi:MAG: hypothetical protein ACRDYA_06195 [Egibacteraceae bacterium]
MSRSARSTATGAAGGVSHLAVGDLTVLGLVGGEELVECPPPPVVVDLPIRDR